MPAVAAQLKRLAAELKCAISTSEEIYEAELEAKAGGKRKREDNPEEAAKKQENAAKKKEESATMDWSGMHASGTLHKATIPHLKEYCKANALTVPSNAKKPDYLQVVQKHLEHV